MKKLLAIILFLSAFNAFSQAPPISITPSFRKNTPVNSKDSIAYTYTGIIGGYGWLYNAEYLRANFAPKTGGLYKLKTDSTANSGYVTHGYFNSQKGVANGISTLDGSGKVPLAQLPANLLVYKGQWNPSTNTPTMVNGTGTAGDVWEASADGDHNFGAGTQHFLQGDFVIYNGSTWELSAGTDRVTSVNGYQGIVDLSTSDISEGTNKYYTDARVGTYGDAHYLNLTGSNANTSISIGGHDFSTSGNISAGDIFAAGGFVSQGNASGSIVGAALTGGYYSAGGYAFFQAFNYTSSGYLPLQIDGSTVYINANSGGIIQTGPALYVGNARITTNDTFKELEIGYFDGSSYATGVTKIHGSVILQDVSSAAGSATGLVNINSSGYLGIDTNTYLGLHATADNSTKWNSQSITTSGLATNDILQYNGSAWQNATNTYTSPLHRSGGNTSIDQANTSTDGYLVHGDWNTFNNKQSALTFGTGLINTSNTITNNLSTGVSGGQSAIGGTSSTDALTIKYYTGATSSNSLLLDANGLTYGTGTSAIGRQFYVSPTLTDNTAAYSGFFSMPIANNITVGRGTAFRGFTSQPEIGALNTQGWSSGANLIGFSSLPTIVSGASGGITNSYGYQFGVSNSSSTVTLSNAFGITGSIANSGTLTTAAYMSFGALTAGTNNTYANFGGTPLTGNWGITQQSANPSWFNGDFYIKSSTALGYTAALQVHGLAGITKIYSGTTGVDSVMVHGSDGKIKAIDPNYYASDASVVHLAGSETITGDKNANGTWVFNGTIIGEAPSIINSSLSINLNTAGTAPSTTGVSGIMTFGNNYTSGGGEGDIFINPGSMGTAPGLNIYTVPNASNSATLLAQFISSGLTVNGHILPISVSHATPSDVTGVYVRDSTSNELKYITVTELKAL